jgi:hypothetical protein
VSEPKVVKSQRMVFVNQTVWGGVSFEGTCPDCNEHFFVGQERYAARCSCGYVWELVIEIRGVKP